MKILLILILTTVFNHSYAHQHSEICKEISKAAGTIMNARQSGVPMYEVMEIKPPEVFSDLFSILIEEAYETSRYSTESLKQRTIEDFENTAFLACYKAINKSN